MKKTIASSPERLFLNSLPCRKPPAKLYIPAEPGALCPGRAPARKTRSSCEQGGLLAPSQTQPRGYQLPGKGFSSPRSFITSHTPCKATEMNPAVAATAEEPSTTAECISQRPSPADGCSRGKATDLNI